MSAPITITAANFESEVLQSATPVLVDFFATWCGPCRALAPTVDAVAEELGGKLKVGKCDVDQSPDLAARFSVMSVPTLIVFKGGQVVETMMGAQPKSRLMTALEKHLA